ncbi:MAG: ABC transporter ATP-binding protein, partial [Nocardiopsaceae bacterium]|nr:ABC transporter ATP-binding protein [Nocardiopsaceae bacterium]
MTDRAVGRSPARLVTGVTVRYLRKHPADGVWLAIWSVLEAVPTYAFGRSLSEATNAFLAGRAHLLTGLGWLGLLMVAAAVGSVGSAMAYRRLAAIVEPLRDDLVRRIVAGAVRRSVDLGEAPDTGAAARISHQTEIVRDSFGGLLSVLRRFAFVAGSALVGLATLLPMALALAAGPLVLGLVIFSLLVGPLVRRQRDSVLTEEAVSADGTEVMTALRDITACGGESRVYARSAHRVDEQVHATRSAARVAAARSLTVAVGGMLPIPLVLAAVPWLLRHGASPGQIVGALAYLAGGLQPALNTLVQGLGSSGVRMAVTLDRILEQAELPPRRLPAATRRSGRRLDTAAFLAQKETCDLETRGLTFGYGQRAIPVISDLSLKIPDGDHVAIVGPSGVGKSTLAGLIAGTLVPTAGEVRIGGVPVRDLGPADLARRRVLIPQEAYVFTGTLAENLTYLNRRADPARVRKTASGMGLDPLVDRLGGYQKPLDPAVLSAGERQLIALARAYLSPARLVLLDEATCHLDPAAEAKAEEMFARRPGAVLIIAHRMSSALRAQRVLVLDGDRAEIGTHETMLRR